MIEMTPIFFNKITKIHWNLNYDPNTLKPKKLLKYPQNLENAWNIPKTLKMTEIPSKPRKLPK